MERLDIEYENTRVVDETCPLEGSNERRSKAETRLSVGIETSGSQESTIEEPSGVIEGTGRARRPEKEVT
jgi:hypothetical protein